MRSHAHTFDRQAAAAAHEDLATRWLRFVLDRFLLLPLGVVIALVWAQTEPDGYFRFAQAIAYPVNEIGMAIFLALIAQELYESLLPGGALASWRNRALPGLAAVAGLVGSVVTYFLLIGAWHEQALAPAWPAAAAVDLAAGYYLVRLIYPRRSRVVSFLLLTGVLTDSIVIAIVSLRPSSSAIHLAGLTLFAALASAVLLRLGGVKSFWPYWTISGSLSWFALNWIDIHPALALVPIVPLLPHDRRAVEVFADRPDADPVHAGEHAWNGAAQIAVFLFGMANGGVILRHADTGTWAVLLAAVIGRPIGVMTAIALVVAAGFRLPAHLRWRDITVVAMATTTGFTFALFLGAAMLPIGAVREQVTIGALATVVGALLTLAIAAVLGAGRFRRGLERS